MIVQFTGEIDICFRFIYTAFIFSIPYFENKQKVKKMRQF